MSPFHPLNSAILSPLPLYLLLDYMHNILIFVLPLFQDYEEKRKRILADDEDEEDDESDLELSATEGDDESSSEEESDDEVTFLRRVDDSDEDSMPSLPFFFPLSLRFLPLSLIFSSLLPVSFLSPLFPPLCSFLLSSLSHVSKVSMEDNKDEDDVYFKDQSSESNAKSNGKSSAKSNGKANGKLNEISQKTPGKVAKTESQEADDGEAVNGGQGRDEAFKEFIPSAKKRRIATTPPAQQQPPTPSKLTFGTPISRQKYQSKRIEREEEG